MAFKYARYIARVTRHPFALLPEKMSIVTELFRERMAGHKLSDEEIVARLGDDADTPMPQARSEGAVFVLPIHGTIAHRADSFEASSGGASAERIGKLLDRAVADESIKSILLDVDSPGGSVEGIPELAAKIARAKAVKPVVAQVCSLCASAAYWLASQASEIVITPSGLAGSIGVFMLTVDASEHLAKEGIKVNAISAGDYKLEGAEWEPLSDEARAHYQSQVDAVYRDFIGAVAKGRGATVAQVKESYGQGRVFDAKEALKRGMVDRVATMDETIARMVRAKPGQFVSSRASASAHVTLHGTEMVLTAEQSEALAEQVATSLAPVSPKTDGEAEAVAESLPAPAQPVTDDEAAILAALAD